MAIGRRAKEGEDAVPLRTMGLGKVFPNGTEALRGATLVVRRGELISIIGRSGAGKSTLLRCINRLVEPTSGRIELMGEDVTHRAGRALARVRQRVGMIFQQFNLVGRLTVLQNVEAGRLRFHRAGLTAPMSIARRLPRGEREFAFECLKKVGIERIAFQRADTLSGGQQQRVAIARTLAQEPAVILADEPIASLDPKSAMSVMETLERIHEEHGTPILVNLHQVDVATRYSTRVIGMRAGEIVFDGSPETVDHSVVEHIYAVADATHRRDPGLEAIEPGTGESRDVVSLAAPNRRSIA